MRYLAVFFALALAIPSGVAAQTAEPAVPPSPADAFFDDSVVHDVFLNINSRDWQALKANALDNTYYPCDMRWRDQVVRNIGIRSRGTGSRSGSKPGLRVDFNRYTSDQTFLGVLKSFVLRNNTQDASTMHERISMLFFRRMGVTAPREAHARLFINNAYAGLYTIVESVDKAFLKRAFKEDGGHLYKYDYDATDKPWYFDSRGADPALYVPKPFKPETHEQDPRPEKIAALVDIVNHDSGAVFRRTIEPILDLAQFVRHIAVEIFLADKDGFNGDWGMNNFYFYRLENRELFRFIPWDKSEAFKDGPRYDIWHNIDVPSWLQNRLTGRVLDDAGLRRLFLDTLAECARSLSETDPGAPGDRRGWMEREVEREYAQVQEWAALAAEDRVNYSRDAFERDVENLRVFARERSQFVLDAVAKSR